jgi:hypothetical protein
LATRTSPSITASFHAAGETGSGARLREMIPGRLPGRRSMLKRPLSLSGNSESAKDGTLDRMSPAAHASISHAWARPTLVFCAVLIISTAFEMAHHVLAVIFACIPGSPGSKLRFNEGSRHSDRTFGFAFSNETFEMVDGWSRMQHGRVHDREK